MKSRDAALKKSLKTGLLNDILLYKSLRNKVTSLLSKTKAIFFLNPIEQSKGNTKRLWQTIDKIIGRKNQKRQKLEITINGNLETDAQHVANYFNNYFIHSVSELCVHLNN